MKLAIKYLYILFLLPYSIKAQILGIVKDLETDKPIAQASIHIQNTKIGCVSDIHGRFTLSFQSDKQFKFILIHAIGYQSKLIDWNNIKITDTLIVSLKKNVDSLTEFILIGSRPNSLSYDAIFPMVKVDALQLKQSAETNIMEAIGKQAPGLHLMQTGPNISKPFIRGLGYNRVVTLFDGIRQEGQQWGDEHGLEIDGYHVGEVSVIKGPASLIYGSDAIAGVVSISSESSQKQAAGKVSGNWVSEFQSNNGLVGNSIGLSLNSKKWLYRITNSIRLAKDYVNPIDGAVFNTGFKEINATAAGYFQKDKNSFSWHATLYDNMQEIPDGSRDSLTRQFTYPIAEGEQDDPTTRPIVPVNQLKSYNLNPIHQRIQHYRAYVIGHREWEKATMDYQLGFQHNRRREFNHPTLPNQASMYVSLHTINYGWQLRKNWSKKIEWISGINGMWQKNSNYDATNFPIPDYQFLDFGLFSLLQFRHHQWLFSFGGRWDNRWLKVDDLFVTKNPETGLSQRGDFNNGEQQYYAFQKWMNGSSFGFMVRYEWSKSIALKINIGKGYRAPNINELAANGLDPGAHIKYISNQNFQPEVSWQKDLNLEWKKDNWQANFSVFLNTIQHFIFMSKLTDSMGNEIRDAQGNKTYAYQQANARIYGGEFNWRYSSNTISAWVVEQSFSYVRGFNLSENMKNKGNFGYHLPLIPPPQLLSAVSKTWNSNNRFLQETKLKFEWEWNAAQNHFLALDQTETATPSYSLLHFSVAQTWIGKHNRKVSLLCSVNNLGNVAYQSHLSRLKYFEYYQQSSSGKMGIFNMGRNFCFKMLIDF